jgi:hypothetical protein
MIILHYRHKKDLKNSIGKRLKYTETSMFGYELDPENGQYHTVGTNHPKRSWFAQVTVDDQFRIVKVS